MKRRRGRPKKKVKDRKGTSVTAYVEPLIGDQFTIRCMELGVSRSERLGLLIKKDIGAKDKLRKV